MTTLRDAAQQALEALDLAFEKDLTYLSDHAMIARQDVVRSRLAITTLRVAIAEASMQRLTDVQQEIEATSKDSLPVEPVGQLQEEAFGRGQVMWLQKPPDNAMLYTHPPRREWVGLTDEEIDSMRQGEQGLNFVTFREFRIISRAIEAKLKEKNHVC